MDGNPIRRNALVALAIVLASCGSGNGENNTQNNTSSANNEPATDAALREAVLLNVGSAVIVAQQEDFAQKAAALTDALEAWQGDGSDASRATARDAWKEAMSSWQRVEVYQLGPTGVMGQVAGGESIRDAIYSWPISSACRVDQELVAQDYADAATFFAEERVNVRGLDAMERLLFEDSYENACSAVSEINSSGSWDALGEDGIDANRAAYSLALARDIESRAEALVDHWSPDGKNFLGEFSTAGKGSSTYASSQEALNALSDALFYIEKETKDMKLAIPAGLSGCNEDTCPEDRESLYANFSKEEMIANIQAFRAAFTGLEAEGFDDLLINIGAEQLSTDMLRLTDETIALLEAWPGTLEEQLRDDPQSVVDAYTKASELGTLLKTQFVSTLDLEIPQRAEGDND